MKLKNNYFIYLRYEKTGSKTLIREIFNKFFHYYSLKSLSKNLFDEFIEDKEGKFQNEIFIINIQIQKNIIKDNLIILDIEKYYYDILNFLKYVKKNYNLKIILGIRAQNEIIESYYTQIAKNGYFISKNKFYKTHHKIWQYYYILKNIHKIFLKEHIHIFILNNNYLLKELENLYFFLAQENKVFRNVKKYNIRRSHNQVKLYMFFNFIKLRGVNKFIKIPIKEKIIYIISSILDRIFFENTKKNYYKEYISLYEEDNRKIEKYFKLDLKGRGFDL